jgi:hypothetical protein
MPAPPGKQGEAQSRGDDDQCSSGENPSLGDNEGQPKGDRSEGKDACDKPSEDSRDAPHVLRLGGVLGSRAASVLRRYPRFGGGRCETAQCSPAGDSGRRGDDRQASSNRQKWRPPAVPEGGLHTTARRPGGTSARSRGGRPLLHGAGSPRLSPPSLVGSRLAALTDRLLAVGSGQCSDSGTSHLDVAQALLPVPLDAVRSHPGEPSSRAAHSGRVLCRSRLHSRCTADASLVGPRVAPTRAS